MRYLMIALCLAAILVGSVAQASQVMIIEGTFTINSSYFIDIQKDDYSGIIFNQNHYYSIVPFSVTETADYRIEVVEADFKDSVLSIGTLNPFLFVVENDDYYPNSYLSRIDYTLESGVGYWLMIKPYGADELGYWKVEIEGSNGEFVVDDSQVPLPPALLLFASGIAGIVGIRRTRKS